MGHWTSVIQAKGMWPAPRGSVRENALHGSSPHRQKFQLHSRDNLGKGPLPAQGGDRRPALLHSHLGSQVLALLPPTPMVALTLGDGAVGDCAGAPGWLG